MRYTLAVICPPLAFVACGKRLRAAVAAVLFVAAVATARIGVGVAIDFLLVLWAFAAVGDHDAHREAVAFIKAAGSPSAKRAAVQTGTPVRSTGVMANSVSSPPARASR